MSSIYEELMTLKIVHIENTFGSEIWVSQQALLSTIFPIIISKIPNLITLESLTRINIFLEVVTSKDTLK